MWRGGDDVRPQMAGEIAGRKLATRFGRIRCASLVESDASGAGGSSLIRHLLNMAQLADVTVVSALV